MANGDLAASKGWDTVEQTDDVKVGYDDINYALDKAAEVLDAATAMAGGKLDANKIVTSATTPTDPAVMYWAKPL